MLYVHFQVDQQQNTDNRISQMFDLTFRNTSGDEEKRKQVCPVAQRYSTICIFYILLITGITCG